LSGFSEFSPQIFETHPNIKFPEYLVGEPSCTVRKEDGQTDRQTDIHDEADSRFPQIGESDYKLICVPVLQLAALRAQHSGISANETERCTLFLH
jgi:hypothetical protein